MGSRPNRIASVKVSAGYRTYFLDLERHGEYGVCLVMSESKRLTDHQFERHRIIVDNEHLEGFVAALQKLLNESGLMGSPGQPNSGEIIAGNTRDKDASSEGRSFAVIRQTYPRAYASWRAIDDERLRDAFKSCKETQVLADTFGRKPGAIQSRLRKLGLLS